MPTEKVSKRGRPKIEFDQRAWAEIYGLCEIQCTAEEIAGFLRISVDTLERRIKEKFKQNFAEFFAMHRTVGQISLRRSLFNLAKYNAISNKFALINYCGLSDKHEIEIPDVGEYFKEITNALHGLDTNAIQLLNRQTSSGD